MTSPSANPRRFSKGVQNLNPNEPAYVYFSLIVTNRESIKTSFSAIDRYKEDWPQARVSPAGIMHENGMIRLVFQIDMGRMRKALKGESPEVQAGYGFLYTICKNLFHLRPALTSAPTPEERALVDAIIGETNAPSNNKN